MDKTTPPAEKVRRATEHAVLKTEYKHIKDALDRLEHAPTKCDSHLERVTEIEKTQAGISMRHKLGMAWQIPLVLLVLGMAVTGLQVCAAHETGIAQAHTERAGQKEDIKTLESGYKQLEAIQREDTTRVLRAIGELQSEVRVISQKLEPARRRGTRR